jgi:hypothetical protein
VLLPHGTFYRFKATSDEPLVMVRIGAAALDGADPSAASAPTAGRCAATRSKNKQVELIMSDHSFR